MILKSVRIENYKSVEDSNEFSVGPVTCLVGKNESGKSAILQALYKLNPVIEKDREFDTIVEYPRGRLGEYEEALKDADGKPANVLTTVWELEEPEHQAFLEVFGPQTLTSKIVTIRKGYDNSNHWDVDLDEQEVLKHLFLPLGTQEQKQWNLQGAGTVAEFIARLEAAESPSAQQAALLVDLNSKFPKKEFAGSAIEFLHQFLPAFVYFPDYEKMPGRVSIDDLLARSQANNLELRHRIFLALLDLAGTTPEQISGIPNLEPLIAKLEGVSNRISKEIFTYWSQNKYLKVRFHFDAGRSNDQPPFNSGYVFQTRIENTRHGVTVSFDERSSGFVWFFSFLVWFSRLQRNFGEKLVILLDEPGLSLHGRAQADLLRYINEKLKLKYQVIYTTHSPFMIDPANLLSARTVEDVVVKNETTGEEEIRGTKVGDQVLSTDADTLFPLQAALGYEITQTLFIGEHTLLVEGASDLLYLKWFSHELQTRGRTNLDPRWVITPAGGVDKIGAFLTLFGGNKLHAAVFIDLQEGQKRKVRDLRDSTLLKQGHVFTADMYATQSEADTEDMLGRTFYIALVNECYQLKSNSLPKNKPPGTPERVVKEVESHFRTLPPSVSEFDHYAPSVYLTENTATLRTSLPDLDPALDRFEKLFIELNALLPS